MAKTRKFKFPPQILNQVSECSTGFFLVVLNQDQEFEVFQNLPTPVLNLSMANFLEIYSTNLQESLRVPPEDRKKEVDDGDDD